MRGAQEEEVVCQKTVDFDRGEPASTFVMTSGFFYVHTICLTE